MLVLGWVTLVWLGAAVMTWVNARHELDELLDGHLAQAAALLVVQQSTADHDDDVADAPTLHKYAPKVMFQVFHEGQLVMRSSNAGLAPLTTTTRGFDSVRLGDGSRSDHDQRQVVRTSARGRSVGERQVRTRAPSARRQADRSRCFPWPAASCARQGRASLVGNCGEPAL